MKNFYLITNVYKDEQLRMTKIIQEYIEKRGGSCDYFLSHKENGHYVAITASDIPKDTECILVLGGDGTLIRAARQVVGLSIPLIGVNMGTLGYLCELESSNIFPALDMMLEDKYETEERIILSGHMGMPGEKQTSRAINDVVIHRVGRPQMINLIVYVNGEYLHTFNADGIIIATPTGSTAYNMSAGGPIVDPKAKLILLTPISSHDLNSRSIVVGSEDEIVVELGSRRPERDEQAEVSFDGDSKAVMAVGERIIIKAASERIQILKLSKISFLEILRRKM